MKVVTIVNGPGDLPLAKLQHEDLRRQAEDVECLTIGRGGDIECDLAGGDYVQNLHTLLVRLNELKDDVLVLMPQIIVRRLDGFLPAYPSWAKAVGACNIVRGEVDPNMWYADRELLGRMRNTLRFMAGKYGEKLDSTNIFTLLFLVSGVDVKMLQGVGEDLGEDFKARMEDACYLNVGSPAVVERLQAAKLDVHSNVLRFMENITTGPRAVQYQD